MKTRLFALMFVIVAGQVQAQQITAPAVGEQQVLDQQRNELMAQKQVVLQTHAKLQEQCWQRFAVNDCLRDVRRAQRKALAPVEAQLIELNARERQLRLQEREQRLQDKAK
jgi:hypothetical protein